MIEAGSLEYASARIAARYGDRADEMLWRSIELIRDFASLLTTVRASPLAVWIVGVGEDADAHAIESASRRHWRLLSSEVAAWMPPEWRAAVAWCAALTDLPALQHTGRGQPRPPWLDADLAAGRALAGADAALAALHAAGGGDARRLRNAWRAEWLRRLPGPLVPGTVLHQLVTLLDGHLRLFAAAHPADGWPLRRALHARLGPLFRRAALDPGAAFVYLALTALDYERIRAELLRRRVFPLRRLAA